MKWFGKVAAALIGMLVAANGQLPPECEELINPPYVEVILVQNVLNDPNGVVQKAFEDAAKRWSEIIKTDLPDVTLQNNVNLEGRCGAGAVLPAGKTVNNVIIFAKVQNIDGAGRVLGQARPCLFTRVDGAVLPRAGEMTFDSSDVVNLVNQGTFDGVVLHEMGHILGIGSGAWRNRVVGLNGNDPEYTGTQGLQGFADIGGSQGDRPDVENVGGGGTFGSHWRTSTFQNELMTGFLSGNEQPISRMTVGSLIDIGYTVDIEKADAFTIPTRRVLEEHEMLSHEGHQHRHLADSDGWEQPTWPDISQQADGLSPTGVVEVSTAGSNVVPSEGGSNAGLIVGSGLAGAFIALAVVGAVYKRNQMKTEKAVFATPGNDSKMGAYPGHAASANVHRGYPAY